MIKPTVGRVVWFWKYWSGQAHKGPLAALVTKVFSDTMVNLAVFGEDGRHFAETNIFLKQEPAAPVPEDNYCEWMPYQHGQAAKAEALEKQLAAK